jgi:long-chain acyl-CoA synthetase
VLPEPWTEQNHFLNSSMKVVRGRVEEAYKEHMEYAYTPEGKPVVNKMNMASL